MSKFRLKTSSGKTLGKIVSTLPRMPKFHVHFRHPSTYKGEYGFDWLRDEYIHPIEFVNNDNNGSAINTNTPICKDVTNLKSEYKKDIGSPIDPFGQEYYPAWLSIFPYTTTAEFKYGSTIHQNGINLDIEIEEIESLVIFNTELEFKSSNNTFLKVSPPKIMLRDLLTTKRSKNLGGGKIKNYYAATNKINVKCEKGALNKHEYISVLAKGYEVGRLMVYKNDVIPKAEFVVVNVITNSTRATLNSNYQYILKKQSFNQALIRAEVRVDTEFNITTLPNNPDVIAFKTKYLNAASNIGTANSSDFKNDLIALYEQYGTHKPSGSIDADTNKRTYLFYTVISAQDTYSGGYSRVEGEASASATGITFKWGNAYVIFGTALNSGFTIVHEAGHSLSLTHTFQDNSILKSPHVFYMGFSDNIMDYVNQTGVTTRNPYEGKMNSFYKWQWDIMRGDRSLIFNY